MTPEEIHLYFSTPGQTSIRFFPYAVADELSDLAAVLLNDLHRRQENRAKPLVKDGVKWSFDAAAALLANHPYASESGIRKALLSLEAVGYLTIEKTGKFNRKKYDRKWWHHVTVKGCKNAKVRLIRFHPDIATAHGIPKAVLLANIRHQLHQNDGAEWAVIEPNVIGIPYHPRTIFRHLEELVTQGLLERDLEDKHRYRPVVPAPDWRLDQAPLTVNPAQLLPVLNVGNVGLLVGHSGAGKTSTSIFAAVQNALAGTRVLYVTLEEPIRSLSNRIYAQELGLSYSALHQHDHSALGAVSDAIAAPPERLTTIIENLKFVDLSGEPVQCHEILDAVEQKIVEGFSPDIVIVDQLERIEVLYDEPDGELAETTTTETDGLPEHATIPILAAQVVGECLRGQPFTTWILHQAHGAATTNFGTRDVAGGTVVTGNFDAVVGIGRDGNSADRLRLFSLTNQVRFEQIVDADFPRMRFKPIAS